MKRTKNKFYAVANGRKIGIFNTWDETKPLIDGFPGAKYKSFTSWSDAQNYINDNNNTTRRNNTKGNEYEQKPISETITTHEIETDNTMIVYTDGSCVDKVGGVGIVILYNDSVVPLSGKVPSYPTTNQVAELYAIYTAIYNILLNYTPGTGFVPGFGIIIYTDSKYSIGCLTEWYRTWQKNGWINSKGEPVANKELIQSILQISQGLNIKYKHVKGHAGNKYNEWADKLANEGRLL